MEKSLLLQRFKSWVSKISWKIFIWSLDTTEEKYWEEIYEQEKRFKELANEDNSNS